MQVHGPVEDALVGLDPAQKEAASTEAERLIILAAAGSGKTRTIIGRVRWLMAKGVPPSGIVVTTFTRKAAEELQERFAATWGAAGAEVQVGTFHSLSLRWLRAAGHPRVAGAKASSEPQGEAAARAALRRALVDAGLAADPEAVGRAALALSVYRNRRGAESESSTLGADALTTLARELASRRAARGAWDFDDLQEILCAELEENTALGSRIAAPLRHVLVDEAQDLSPLQAAILEAMALRGVARTLVGDDWQSIYGFRAADPRMLVEAASDPAWTVRTIPTNYRSTPAIVQAADRLIRNNTIRTGKDTRAARPAGHPVRILTFPSRAAEVQRIVAWAAQADHSGGRQEGRGMAAVPEAECAPGRAPGLAILLRTNALVAPFESALLRAGLPYRVLGREGTGLAECEELRPLVAWMRMVIDDRAWEALRDAWTAPPRYLRREDLDAVSAEARRSGLLHTLRSTRGAWRTMATDLTILRRWWHDPRVTPAEFLRRLLDLRPRFRGMNLRGALRGHAVRHLRRQAGPSLTLEDARTLAAQQSRIPLLRDLAVGSSTCSAFASRLLTQGAGARPPQLELGTIHQSKGREWSTVWLPCWEEGVFPDAGEDGSSDLEEERRVAYVAITRARDRLVISHQDGRVASRFIREALGERSRPDERSYSLQLVSSTLQRWFSGSAART